MTVLGHIHTFNDQDVIEDSLRALLVQTRPLDGIVIVDNGSTDGTLQREFPRSVTVIRHSENLGTSGAVASGFTYALERGYDWIWILDADSAPQPDALERLLLFYQRLPAAEQAKVQSLGSIPLEPAGPYYGSVFGYDGCKPVKLDVEREAYECDAVIWTGALFRVAGIRAIGLPSVDYVLDWGEFAYGYEGKRRGFKTYVVPSSVLRHNIGGVASGQVASVRWGLFRFNVPELPAIRLYYLVRNRIYFWLYEYRSRGWRMYLSCLRDFIWIPKYLIKLLLLGRSKELRACLRGVRDGVFRQMHRRY